MGGSPCRGIPDYGEDNSLRRVTERLGEKLGPDSGGIARNQTDDGINHGGCRHAVTRQRILM